MAHLEARSGAYCYVNSENYAKMPFYIYMAGFDHCSPDYCVIRKPSPMSVVGVTIKGTGIITQNEKTVEAPKGSLFLVNCEDSHEYHPDSEWDFYWVNILGNYWREILVQYGLEQEIVFPDFKLENEFIQMIQNITTNSEDHGSWQLAMQAFLYRVILYLYRDQQIKRENTIAAKIKAIFEKNVDTNRTQAEICKEMGITPRHAQRIFKTEYGISIHEFVQREKIKRAKAFLRNTTFSVKHISEALGFKNDKYFSVFFHKNCNQTPMQYREQYGWQNKRK